MSDYNKELIHFIFAGVCVGFVLWLALTLLDHIGPRSLARGLGGEIGAGAVDLSGRGQLPLMAQWWRS